MSKSSTSFPAFEDGGFHSWAKQASIGDRLSLLLKHREMKQTELADKIGCTQAAISNIVTDDTRRPNAETLLRMQAVLQCSGEWLILGEGEPFEVNVIGNQLEKNLLHAFRSWDKQDRIHLIAFVEAMAKKNGRLKH